MMTTLRETVLAELATGIHTEAFADGARWAVQQAEKPVCDSSWHAVGPTRAQPVCLACQGTSKTITALTVLRAHRFVHDSAEDIPSCTCGGWEPETATRDLEEHEEHVAAMLGAGTLTDRGGISMVDIAAEAREMYGEHANEIAGRDLPEHEWRFELSFRGGGTATMHYGATADDVQSYLAIMRNEGRELALAQPTRDELAAVIHPDCTSGPGQCPNWDAALKSADAVLALLNGSAS